MAPRSSGTSTRRANTQRCSRAHLGLIQFNHFKQRVRRKLQQDVVIVMDALSRSPPDDGVRKRMGTSFEHVLAPMSCETFVERVWERECCVISGRPADHYKDILTATDMDEVVALSAANPQPQTVQIVKFGDSGQVMQPVPRTAEGDPDLRAVYRAYADGSSIKVDGLQRRWGPVARAIAGAQEVLHHPVGAFAFFTPAGAQ